MYIPDGFHTVTPYMFVKDAAAYSEFLCNAFNAEELLRSHGPGGAIANLQIRIGDSTFMLTDAVASYPAMSSAYYLFVENADESVAQALAAGAELEMAVGDMPYGDRQGGVRDTEGNIWWVSQRLVEAPYSA